MIYEYLLKIFCEKYANLLAVYGIMTNFVADMDQTSILNGIN